MITRRGQATVEWLAVLVVAAALAGIIVAGAQGASARRAAVERSLNAIATAGATAATAPVPPLIGALALPTIDGASIVAIAAQLAGAGIAEAPPGSNGGPGVDVFTDGNAEAWCADFVSWVLQAAGHPFSGGASSGWRLAWTGDVRTWFVARAAFRERLVAHGHVGIVVRTRGDDLETIEGNAGDAVTRRTYAHWRLNPDIGGFGRPGAALPGG